MQLLNQLDRLGTALDNYSFEELKTAEALKLKQHYSALEERLHKNIFGSVETNGETTLAYDMAEPPAEWSELDGILAELKKSKLDSRQRALIERLEQVTTKIKGTTETA